MAAACDVLGRVVRRHRGYLALPSKRGAKLLPHCGCVFSAICDRSRGEPLDRPRWTLSSAGVSGCICAYCHFADCSDHLVCLSSYSRTAQDNRQNFVAGNFSGSVIGFWWSRPNRKELARDNSVGRLRVSSADIPESQRHVRSTLKSRNRWVPGRPT